MAKHYNSMKLDFIRQSTTLPDSGIPYDLSEIQMDRLGNRLPSLKVEEYHNYQHLDMAMAKITALAKKVAAETKQPYEILLLWSNCSRTFDAPRFFGLTRNRSTRNLLIPTEVVQCWPLLSREEEHAKPNGDYNYDMYYHYCLASNGDLIVVSRGSNFSWEPYRPPFKEGLFQGGSFINPIKADDIMSFDYKALWQTDKRASCWREGNRHSFYDPNSGKYHTEACLVEYPGEGITIMLERLLQGGNVSFRIGKNKAAPSEIAAYREQMKKQELAEGFAYTDEEISFLVQYFAAKQALDVGRSHAAS